MIILFVLYMIRRCLKLVVFTLIRSETAGYQYMNTLSGTIMHSVCDYFFRNIDICSCSLHCLLCLKNVDAFAGS